MSSFEKLESAFSLNSINILLLNLSVVANSCKTKLYRLPTSLNNGQMELKKSIRASEFSVLIRFLNLYSNRLLSVGHLLKDNKEITQVTRPCRRL